MGDFSGCHLMQTSITLNMLSNLYGLDIWFGFLLKKIKILGHFQHILTHQYKENRRISKTSVNLAGLWVHFAYEKHLHITKMNRSIAWVRVVFSACNSKHEALCSLCWNGLCLLAHTQLYSIVSETSHVSQSKLNVPATQHMFYN